MHRSLVRSVGLPSSTTFAILLTLIVAPAVGGEIQVTVTNNAPAGGAYLTPVWLGFHDGSFDSYNGWAQLTTGP